MPVSLMPRSRTSLKSSSLALIHAVISGNLRSSSRHLSRALLSFSVYTKNSDWRIIPYGPPSLEISLNRSTICFTEYGAIDCCPSRKVVSVIQMSSGMFIGTRRWLKTTFGTSS